MANLKFYGFRLPEGVDVIPKVHGIYAAFAGVIYENNKCGINRLIYIGKADAGDTVQSRIDDHINDRDESDSGKQSYWERQYCEKDEVILYAYAEYDEDDLEDVEKALIFKNQPLANIYHKDRYNGNTYPLRVICTGSIGTLKREILIRQ